MFGNRNSIDNIFELTSSETFNLTSSLTSNLTSSLSTINTSINDNKNLKKILKINGSNVSNLQNSSEIEEGIDNILHKLKNDDNGDNEDNNSDADTEETDTETNNYKDKKIKKIKKIVRPVNDSTSSDLLVTNKLKRASTNELDDDDIESDGIVNIQKNVVDNMKKNYLYPEQDDPDIQYKMYKKREYYYNKIPSRPNMNKDTEYSIIKDYRDNICARPFTLHEHQGMLSNFINPDTPYKGILVFHGLGTGKCITKDAKVYIDGNNMEIEKIWNMYKTKTIFIDKDNGNWSKPNKLLRVLSWDNGEMVEKKILHLYREKVKTNVRRIILENGNNITITFVHKLLTRNGWTNEFNIGNEICFMNNSQDTFSYSKIVNIDIIEYDDYVYDLEIQNTHNFVANNILCHNTCVGVAIAEKFKDLVQKYNTKIHILVPGPILKENWKKHLVKCTGETYKKYQDKNVYLDEAEKEKENKKSITQALQNYKILSYKSFYKRVLGEKIRETSKDKKKTYRKTIDGDFERDLSVERIYNLNNTLLIVDEAHNLTENSYGEALKKMLEVSVNLKVVLMTATPMKNLGSDIVELINFLRPLDKPMLRDKIFNSHKNYKMDFKQGGLEYFKNMINGYVSHVRGSDPLTFAERVDKGEIPDGLLFTNLVSCDMLKFQRNIYDSTVKEFDDALDKASEAVANIAFPGLSKDRKNIVGYYSQEGINVIIEQLKSDKKLLNKRIGEKFFGIKKSDDIEDEYIQLTQSGKIITGKILKVPYLKNFSIKFYKALKKLNRLYAGKKGAKTAFIYSNLVKVGIEVFQEILLQNGYLEYQEDKGNYQINDDTLCYYCGKPHKNHDKLNRALIKRSMRGFINNIQEGGNDSNDSNDINDNVNNEGIFSSDSEINENDETIKKRRRKQFEKRSKEYIDIESKNIYDVYDISDSSTEYDEDDNTDENKYIKPHKFYPAVFIAVTGGASDDTTDVVSDDKKFIIDNVFNKMSNKEGKYIKFILGSKVMNEGISLSNVSQVHILEPYFNLGRIDQVVGRAIRWCSHYKLMNENNVYPKVKVYKYAVSLRNENKLSSEEELYKKAEQKYILIKKLERAMREQAFDCPLNVSGNIFNEELEKYKDCDMKSKNKCPAKCDYTKCDYKCANKKLNYEYYDPKRKIYKLIDKNNLDYSTFTHGLAESEIEYAKKKIKEMYITSPVYTINDIIKYVKNSYVDYKKELFDVFFVFKALDSLIPVTDNDFNNFRDTIIDKNNVQGYLIYRDIYYIFQPFDQNEDVPLYYRINNLQEIDYSLSLYNYLKHDEKYKKLRKKITDKRINDKVNINIYNFDKTIEYYDGRKEFDYVGIIDKEPNKGKTKKIEELKDVFKIRKKLPKILDKKRGTGIPSIKGSVCSTSKSKEFLENIAKKVGAKLGKNMTRLEICEKIKNKMLELEKYSTNNTTYIRIPSNHPIYKFPYNLEDRKEHIIKNIKNKIPHKINISTKKMTNKDGDFKGKHYYILTLDDDKKLKQYEKIIVKYGGVKENNKWTISIK
jgi:superfamily II DNA or RNA helicase